MLLSVIFTLLTMLLAEVGAFIAASADCLRRDVFAQYGSRFLLAKDADLTDASPLRLSLPVETLADGADDVKCAGSRSRHLSSKFDSAFQHRLVCPFKVVKDYNSNRLPRIIEKVECICERPATLSPYTKIRCQPLDYKMPVMYKKEGSEEYEHAEETIPLACVPIAPIMEQPEEDFMIPIKAALD
ncbi:hypothetical protein QR680_018477 [Steinernema hermaphroditum]|uniref:Uncharacterized protein n=1 Tax=Steinernema hermaphroditum TaxID=289476 RepID=A0AA39HI31_9BILA|nr:hypothetical protein QR680_018477 [Steinernema hermaphroditum]